jgi:hypothetical protein
MPRHAPPSPLYNSPNLKKPPTLCASGTAAGTAGCWTEAGPPAVAVVVVVTAAGVAEERVGDDDDDDDADGAAAAPFCATAVSGVRRRKVVGWEEMLDEAIASFLGFRLLDDLVWGGTLWLWQERGALRQDM